MTLVYTTVLLMLMVTALTALPQSSDNLASPITQQIHMKIVFRGVEDGFANNEGLLMTLSVVSNAKKNDVKRQVSI